MGIFFVYILKSSVCLAVFYLFYRLLLSRETFHRFNRVVLLSILLLSCLFATGGSYCGEADRGSSNHDDTGTVADAGGYDEYYKCGGIADRGSDGNLDTCCIIGVPGRYFTFCFS